MANKKITSRDVDFAKWYTDVVNAAHLCSYSNVKGCIILEPNGFAIWENIQSSLDKMFKASGHKNVAMPLLIPENLMKKEGELINGFAPEVAWVTMGGQKQLEERMCIRPTSETLFSDYFSTVLNSYRDLPIKLNQWCSVVRWEKETRPFLRSREFWWQEGHTIHETSEEAEEETLNMLKTYETFFRDYLAIPVISGKKTESEKFAGAEYTLTIEALMYNGISLQSGTSHYFGQKFSKAYDIKFLNRQNDFSFAYQTSWGVSSRMIGALIMVHSDDDGLVLPPKIAPIKARIVCIGDDEAVIKLAKETEQKLQQAGISSDIDCSERGPGFKFAEAEVLGIPVRIEIGKRDLENGQLTLARRDTKEKINLPVDADIVSEVVSLMDKIQNDMLARATERRNSMTYEARSFKEFVDIISKTPGFIKADWCGDPACELKAKEARGTKARCIMEGEKLLTGNCVICGKPAKHLVTWGIQY